VSTVHPLSNDRWISQRPVLVPVLLLQAERE
jgi:hypothetical protein